MVPYVQTSCFPTSKARHPDLTADLSGFPLLPKKRTLSLAYPSDVAYEIRLRTLYPRGTTLVATVLYSKDDSEANRAAFKCCAEQLASESEHSRGRSEIQLRGCAAAGGRLYMYYRRVAVLPFLSTLRDSRGQNVELEHASFQVTKPPTERMVPSAAAWGYGGRQLCRRPSRSVHNLYFYAIM